MKDETSGHTQTVKEIRVNCENNSLEIRVSQNIAACHYGYFSCFFQAYDVLTGSFVVLESPVFDPGMVYKK